MTANFSLAEASHMAKLKIEGLEILFVAMRCGKSVYVDSIIEEKPTTVWSLSPLFSHNSILLPQYHFKSGGKGHISGCMLSSDVSPLSLVTYDLETGPCSIPHSAYKNRTIKAR